jgi:hypothetical protein
MGIEFLMLQSLDELSFDRLIVTKLTDNRRNSFPETVFAKEGMPRRQNNLRTEREIVANKSPIADAETDRKRLVV